MEAIASRLEENKNEEERSTEKTKATRKTCLKKSMDKENNYIMKGLKKNDKHTPERTTGLKKTILKHIKDMTKQEKRHEGTV